MVQSRSMSLASRDLTEELGWDRPLGRLLVVDYARPQDSRPEGVVFVFDGGVLVETDVVGMVFPDAEIVSVASAPSWRRAGR